MSSLSTPGSSSIDCEFPAVRIKQEPVDDYYGPSFSLNDEQVPCSSGKLGKRTKPTWSLRELELSDDERDRDGSDSSEYAPSCSEEEVSESDEGEAGDNLSSSGIKKRRLSYSHHRREPGEVNKSFSANFNSRVNSSNSNSSSPSTPKPNNNSPSFLNFQLNGNTNNNNNGKQVQPALRNVSMQSIAHSIATNRKKPTPDLTPLKYAPSATPELFLMEKIDQIRTLNQIITSDAENYTKCLILFDQIFKRLRSHPPSDVKKTVTLQLSGLLELIKKRKDSGNSKSIQDELVQVIKKIHIFLRVWPTTPTTPTNYQPIKPSIPLTPPSPRLPALRRVGTEIRKISLTPGLLRGGAPQGNNVSTTYIQTPNGLRKPVPILPKNIQLSALSSSSATGSDIICVGDDDVGQNSGLKIHSVKTLAPKSSIKTSSSSLLLNLKHGVVNPQNYKLKYGQVVVSPTSKNCSTIVKPTNSKSKGGAVVGSEFADQIPWMGIHESDVADEEDTEIADAVATPPIFSRGAYPPNVPIFLNKQLPVVESDIQVVPIEDPLANMSDNLLLTNNQGEEESNSHEFTNLLKAFATQKQTRIQQGFVTAKTTPTKIMKNTNPRWQGHVPHGQQGDIIILSDSDDDNQDDAAENPLSLDHCTTDSSYIEDPQHVEINSDVQTNFVNESEQLNDECVLGI